MKRAKVSQALFAKVAATKSQVKLPGLEELHVLCNYSSRSVSMWVKMGSWVSVEAQYNNLEILAESGGNLWFPWTRQGREAASWDLSLPFPHQPDTFLLCPRVLAWLRSDQVHQILADVDVAKTVVKIWVLLPNSSWGFGVSQLRVLQQGTLGCWFFAKKKFSQTQWWDCTWEVDCQKNRTPKNHSCTSYSWEKMHTSVEHSVCLATCLCAYIYVADSVLNLCFVVSYSVFINGRFPVKFSGKREISRHLLGGLS